MKAIKIHQRDNVAVAVKTLGCGETVIIDGKNIAIGETIPEGHKLALKKISKGENIIKYAYPIGHAKQEIGEGCQVHTKNVQSNLGELLSYKYTPSFIELPKISPRSFMGYKRVDGKVGIRNEIWIIPTVGCVNSIVRSIETLSQKYLTANIDGIYSYNHPYGCSQLGNDQEMSS